MKATTSVEDLVRNKPFAVLKEKIPELKNQARVSEEDMGDEGDFVFWGFRGIPIEELELIVENGLENYQSHHNLGFYKHPSCIQSAAQYALDYGTNVVIVAKREKLADGEFGGYKVSAYYALSLEAMRSVSGS